MKKISLFWAYMALMFFGCFGIHKLYMGDAGWAVIYALTGGLFFFGMVYDFFTLPMQVAIANRGR